jgi:hypothetical protein
VYRAWKAVHTGRRVSIAFRDAAELFCEVRARTGMYALSREAMSFSRVTDGPSCWPCPGAVVTVIDGEGLVVFPVGPMTHPAERIAPRQIKHVNAKVEFM